MKVDIVNALCFAIYDYKVEVFQSIFTVLNDVQAVRMFVDAAKDKDTVINRHPKDFALVRLGRVSTGTGKLYAEEPAPKFLGSAYSYLADAEDSLVAETESGK